MKHLSAFSGPLAILPSSLDALIPGMQSYIRGEASEAVARYDREEKERKVNQNGLESLSTGTEDVQIVGNTAIMHIPGIITKRYGFLSWWYGGSAADEIAFCARMLGQSEDIDNVIIHTDSPGGSVAGVALAANAVRDLRKTKNVIAVADDMMASAAYWIAGAADQILVNPSSIVGSIGVFAQIVNYSRLLEEEKIDIEIIRAGEFKAMPNSIEPLTDTGRKIVQRGVDYHYDLFVEGHSLNRNIDMKTAKSQANGLVHEGSQAIEAGLADGEGTLEDTVEALQEDNKRKSVFSFMSSILPGSTKGQPVASTEPSSESGATSEPEPVQEEEDDRFATLEAQVKAMEEQNKRLASLVEKQSTIIEQGALANIRNENARFVDHLKDEMKVRASSANGYLAVLDLLAGIPEDEQAIAYDGEKTTVFAFLRNELNAALPLNTKDELAPSEGKDASNMDGQKQASIAELSDLKSRARAYQDAEQKRTGKRPSSDEAVNAVMNQN